MRSKSTRALEEEDFPNNEMERCKLSECEVVYLVLRTEEAYAVSNRIPPQSCGC